MKSIWLLISLIIYFNNIAYGAEPLRDDQNRKPVEDKDDKIEKIINYVHMRREDIILPSDIEKWQHMGGKYSVQILFLPPAEYGFALY